MTYVEKLLSQIESGLQNIDGLDESFEMLLELMATNTMITSIIGLGVFIMFLVVLNMNGHIKKLVSKVEKLEEKINERDIPRVKRNNGERS